MVFLAEVYPLPLWIRRHFQPVTALLGDNFITSEAASVPVSQEARSGEQGSQVDLGVQLPRDWASGTAPCGDCHWVALCCRNNGLQGVARTTRGFFPYRPGWWESTTTGWSGVGCFLMPFPWFAHRWVRAALTCPALFMLCVLTSPSSTGLVLSIIRILGPFAAGVFSSSLLLLLLLQPQENTQTLY